MRAAPFRGRLLFENGEAAITVLRKFTGQDFGMDVDRWDEWLRQNRWVYRPGNQEAARRAAADQPRE